MDKSLLAVIEVPYELRVRCGATGCGHSVWKRIHILQINGTTHIYGSRCFAREFKGEEILTSRPYFHSGAARVLSSEEREMLIQNTERLIERLKNERAEEPRHQIQKPAGGPAVRPAGWATSQNAQVGKTPFSQEERAAVEPEALSNLTKKIGRLNFYSPGFNGLLQSEIDRILRSRIRPPD